MAICLPGMASRVKRAATWAMRSAPLVITMIWMMIRMMNMMNPTIRLPPTATFPKIGIRCPAPIGIPSGQAAVGGERRFPYSRTMRVADTSRASRNKVATSSAVGKTANCRGSSM